MHQAPALLKGAPMDDEILERPSAQEGEEIVFDYVALGLILRSHPLALIRSQLRQEKLQTAAELNQLPNGRHAATAKGVFL